MTEVARENSETSERGQSRVETHMSGAPSLARQAWNESDGTIADAVDVLYRKATADRAFISEKLPQIVRAWCQDEIGSLVGSIRLAAWTPPNADPKGNGPRLANAMRASLLDFPLPGGKRLADADAGEVREAAALYRRDAADAAWKARWLERVAEATGRKRCVANAVSESDLRRLQEEAGAN